MECVCAQTVPQFIFIWRRWRLSTLQLHRDKFTDRRGQHPPAGQSNSSHNLQTENCWLISHLHRLDWNFPTQMNAHVALVFKPQPHPTVLPSLWCSETPDMVQSNRCPQAALGTRGDTAEDCRLWHTHWTEMQKKKKSPICQLGSSFIPLANKVSIA